MDLGEGDEGGVAQCAWADAGTAGAFVEVRRQLAEVDAVDDTVVVENAPVLAGDS